MKTAIIIPARYGSSRFPGKPLVDLRGKSLIQRMVEIGKAVKGTTLVAVATDDDHIEAHVTKLGCQVVRTSSDCRNGSERCHAALATLKQEFDFIVNLQGDTPLTPPSVIEALIQHAASSDADIVTPAVNLSWQEREKYLNRGATESGGTFVVTNAQGKALYFSRFAIPFVRTDSPVAKQPTSPSLKHLGIYGYRPAALARYIKLPPSALEEAEQLEQLRAIENGMSIGVVTVDLKGRTLWSLDTQQDKLMIEKILDSEGEIA